MRLGETLTLLFMGFSLCVSDELAKLEGDVMIEGMFKIVDPEGGSCSTKVETATVRDFEAAKWTLNQLNEANYIPGVRIGKLYGNAYLNKNSCFHYCITNLIIQLTSLLISFTKKNCRAKYLKSL